MGLRAKSTYPKPIPERTFEEFMDRRMPRWRSWVTNTTQPDRLKLLQDAWSAGFEAGKLYGPE